MLVKVKILGIAGSPRHGNTELMIKEALRAAEELPDVEAEFYTLAGKVMNPCDSDYKCWKAPKDNPCPSYEDAFNEVFPKMIQADGIIVGSPVYIGSVTAQLKALIDRSIMAAENSLVGPGLALRNKVCGVVTCAYDRHGGHEGVIFDVWRWAILADMVVVGVGPERPEFGIGCFWGGCAIQSFHADAPKPFWKDMNTAEELTSVGEDKIGIASTRLLAQRVTEVAKVIKAGFASLPEKERKWPYGPTGGYARLGR